MFNGAAYQTMHIKKYKNILHDLEQKVKYNKTVDFKYRFYECQSPYFETLDYDIEIYDLFEQCIYPKLGDLDNKILLDLNVDRNGLGNLFGIPVKFDVCKKIKKIHRNVSEGYFTYKLNDNGKFKKLDSFIKDIGFETKIIRATYDRPKTYYNISLPQYVYKNNSMQEKSIWDHQ